MTLEKPCTLAKDNVVNQKVALRYLQWLNVGVDDSIPNRFRARHWCSHLATTSRYLVQRGASVPPVGGNSLASRPFLTGGLLKLSSSTLRATTLYQVYRDLEDISKISTQVVTPSLVPQLKTEHQKVEITLQVERRRYQE